MGVGSGSAIRKDRKPNISRLPISVKSTSSTLPTSAAPTDWIAKTRAIVPILTVNNAFESLGTGRVAASCAIANSLSKRATNNPTQYTSLLREPSECETSQSERFSAGQTSFTKDQFAYEIIRDPNSEFAAEQIVTIKPVTQIDDQTVRIGTVDMSYTLPNAHIATPCTHKSLTHRLTCKHLVITPQPTDICAGNCADSNGTQKFELRSLPPNPRDLDMSVLCPVCDSGEAAKTRTKSKLFGGRGKGKIVICQLVPESKILPPWPTRRGEDAEKAGSGKNSKSFDDDDGDGCSDIMPPNPLNFSFPGCTPAKKKNDSAMFVPGSDDKPARPVRSITGQTELRVFKLPQLASEA